MSSSLLASLAFMMMWEVTFLPDFVSNIILKSYRWILIRFSGNVCNWTRTKLLEFGGDLNIRLNPGFFFKGFFIIGRQGCFQHMCMQLHNQQPRGLVKRNPGKPPNKFYDISKIDLDPVKILGTLIQCKKKNENELGTFRVLAYRHATNTKIQPRHHGI